MELYHSNSAHLCRNYFIFGMLSAGDFIELSFYCIFFDCIYFGTSLRPCREDFVLSSLAFLILLTFIYYWIRDVIREAIKKYEVLPAGLFIVFLIFVFSEGMLFLSFFWASFHSSLTDIVEEGLYVPDLCDLRKYNYG